MENATQMALGYMNPKARLKTWQGTLGGTCVVGRVQIRKVGNTLVMKKPNGAKLFYHNPRLVTSIDGSRKSFEFDGTAQGSGQWTPQASYGGRMVENLTQSVARDVMAEAVLAAPDGLLMTVHDEIVWEVPDHGGGRAEAIAIVLQQIVENPPAWTAGLPLGSEIKISRRYGK